MAGRRVPARGLDRARSSRPARNALLADIVPPAVYGRAYGFERAMDDLGAIAGPLLALALVGLIGVRDAILLSVIPGLLAAVAVVFAIRQAPKISVRHSEPIHIRLRPLLRGPLGRLLLAMSVLEFGNAAATLLILRATQALTPTTGVESATQIALSLYVAYNVFATLASVPAGYLGDRKSPVLVVAPRRTGIRRRLSRVHEHDAYPVGVRVRARGYWYRLPGNRPARGGGRTCARRLARIGVRIAGRRAEFRRRLCCERYCRRSLVHHFPGSCVPLSRRLHRSRRHQRSHNARLVFGFARLTKTATVNILPTFQEQ